MPDTYTVDDDGLYTVVSEDELSFIKLTNKNPSTGEVWENISEVKEFVATYPYAWTLYSSLPTQDQLDEVEAAANRAKRNQLLADSDWTQMADSPLTDEAKTAWATHRTNLRDLTAHTNWPNLEDADWPTEPS